MTGQKTRGLLLAAAGLMFISSILLARGLAVPGAILLLCGFAAAWRSGFRIPPVVVPARKAWLFAAAVFAAALAVRLFKLDSLPPVFWDEGLQAYDARCLLAGQPLEGLEGVYFHRSPVWTAFLSGFGRVAGFSFFSLRLPSALLGSALCAMVFAWGAARFGIPAALLGAAWLALNPASLNVSRLVFGNVAVPAVAVAIVLVVSSPGIPWRAAAVAAGAAGGAAMYGYAGGLYLPLLAAAGAFMLQPGRSSPARRAAAAGMALGVSVLVSLPLFLGFPGYWDKVRDLSLLARPFEFGGNLVLTSGIFLTSGDPSITHQYPAGAPLFWLLLSPFFSLGLVLVLRSARDPGFAFLFAWLALAILPGAASEEGGRNIFRLAGVLPVAAIILSAGASAVPFLFRKRTGLVILTALLLATAARDLKTYFRDYPADAATGVWFRTYQMEAAKSLKELADVLPVRLCSQLSLSVHPLEKFVLFDHFERERIRAAQGRCGKLGLYKVFRDSAGIPHAVLLVGESRAHPGTISAEYRTVIDIGMQGDEMMREGYSREAVRLYRGYLKWMPDSYLLEERLGFALLKAGDFTGAVDSFIRAVAAGSGSGATFNGLAAAWYSLGDYESAEAAIRKAIAADPGNPEFLADLERILAAAKKKGTSGR